MGGGRVRVPKKGKRKGQVTTHQYRVEIGGEQYLIQTANALLLENLDSKKPGKAEISGEALVNALKAYNVNVLMPGIENFGIIKKITYDEYPDPKTGETKQAERLEGIGGLTETMKLLSKWETTGTATISFEGKEKLTKKNLGLAALTPIKKENPFKFKRA